MSSVCGALRCSSCANLATGPSRVKPQYVIKHSPRTTQHFLGLQNNDDERTRQRRIHENAHKVVEDQRNLSVVCEVRQFENLQCHVPAPKFPEISQTLFPFQCHFSTALNWKTRFTQQGIQPRKTHRTASSLSAAFS
jgi:hypothetical protein